MKSINVWGYPVQANLKKNKPKKIINIVGDIKLEDHKLKGENIFEEEEEDRS